MNQQSARIFAQVRAKHQQHHIGSQITTSIFGRAVTGTIVAIHPFGTVDLETENGNVYRVSGLPLTTQPRKAST